MSNVIFAQLCLRIDGKKTLEPPLALDSARFASKMPLALIALF
jgi:hypothetical protein